MNLSGPRGNLLLILSGFFITNAVVAELISSKLIQLGPFTTIVGILPWPLVFLATDVVNEFYGPKVVRRLSFLTSALIGYAFFVVYGALELPAAPGSPASDEVFRGAFGQSLTVIIGSITAFLLSQLLDVTVFWYIRKLTKARFIWLRATGSTLVSQLIDSYVVLGIGFYLPGTFTLDQYLAIGWDNYTLKILVALGLTPFIYISHIWMKRYIGHIAEEEQEATSL
ncbi:MAG: queuosine precursor transporter [Bacteroidia bacterium]|nr:queuosine precursor transporter [Bacteroidia bacterium]